MSDYLDQIRNDHHNFNKGKLGDAVDLNPFQLFQTWYQEAYDAKATEPNAFTLSTVDQDLKPSSRILFLRDFDETGFTFFTNYNSKKGKDLLLNPFASLLFFWPTLERQIRIEGEIEKASNQVSDAYFASRPKSSQIGAWASQQSEKLNSRSDLEERITRLNDKYPNEVPRPPHWGGYVLKASRFEFWQGRASRLHDRIIFDKSETDSWNIFRLNP